MKTKIKNFDKNTFSLTRAISKLGFASRTNAEKLIIDGVVFVDGKKVTNPKHRVNIKKNIITINKQIIEEPSKIYIILNKPKGLITTLKDEKNRDTVFKCFENFQLPYIFPVGRLDKATEGLLFFTNDTKWSDKIQSSKIDKVYHVKIDSIPEENSLELLKIGKMCDKDYLKFKDVKILRKGKKRCWLEIVLDEGKYRHIRRLLNEFNFEVLQLIRVSIGSIKLGDLKKGNWRFLEQSEIDSI